MKAVKVLTAHCKGGGIDLEPGEILEVGVDITPYDADRKVRLGFLAWVEDAELSETADETSEHPEVGEDLVDRDPKPRGRRRK